MPLTLTKPRTQRISSGLAIQHEAIYYTSLDDDNNPLRQIKVPLPEGCIVNGSVKDFAMLEAGMAELRAQTGRMRLPVNIGLPEGDVIIRPLNFPRMSIEDIKGTLALNFEEYFPFSGLDAAFDVVAIDTPADSPEREEITVLAAASRKNMVEQILDVSRKAGIPAGAVEPACSVVVRAIPEGREGLCIYADLHNIITMWNGRGIFFRTSNTGSTIQDILNTMRFVETQYRNVRVSRIFLHELDLQAGGDSGMEIISLEDEFILARGLAMRDSPNFHPFDLRPHEYVELERRRYQFNPNRLIFYGLLAGFLMLTSGTISFSFFQISQLSREIDYMRSENDTLTARQAELTAANAQLNDQRTQAERVLDFLKGDIPALEIMNAIEAASSRGIKFDTADFTKGAAGGAAVVIDGRAVNEKVVIDMTEGLKESGLFTSVMLPVSQRDMTGGTVFKLLLIVRDILNEG